MQSNSVLNSAQTFLLAPVNPPPRRAVGRTRKEFMRSVVVLAVLTLAVDPRAVVAATLDYSNRHAEGAGGAVNVKSMGAPMNIGLPGGPVTVGAALPPGGNASVLGYTRETVTIPGGGNTLFHGAFSSSAATSLSVATLDFGDALAGGLGSAGQLNDAGLSNEDILVTPEPGTLGLLGTGLLALAGIIRRKTRR